MNFKATNNWYNYVITAVLGGDLQTVEERMYCSIGLTRILNLSIKYEYSCSATLDYLIFQAICDHKQLRLEFEYIFFVQG